MSSPEYVFGLHAVKSLLRGGSAGISVLWLQAGREDERMAEIRDRAADLGIAIEYRPRGELDKLVKGKHQGVVALVEAGSLRGEKALAAYLDELDHPPFLLVLDGVQDPHNLGACLRSADAAGVDAVILPKDKSVGITPTVRKVACGAAETLALFAVTNLARTLQQLRERGIWLYGAAGEESKSLYDMGLSGAIGLVMGSEGKGLRRLTREQCDGLFAIPMAGTVESLNVSVATGICLFEALRQRKSLKPGN